MSHENLEPPRLGYTVELSDRMVRIIRDAAAQRIVKNDNEGIEPSEMDLKLLDCEPSKKLLFGSLDGVSGIVERLTDFVEVRDETTLGIQRILQPSLPETHVVTEIERAALAVQLIRILREQITYQEIVGHMPEFLDQ